MGSHHTHQKIYDWTCIASAALKILIELNWIEYIELNMPNNKVVSRQTQANRVISRQPCVDMPYRDMSFQCWINLLLIPTEILANLTLSMLHRHKSVDQRLALHNSLRLTPTEQHPFHSLSFETHGLVDPFTTVHIPMQYNSTCFPAIQSVCEIRLWRKQWRIVSYDIPICYAFLIRFGSKTHEQSSAGTHRRSRTITTAATTTTTTTTTTECSRSINRVKWLVNHHQQTHRRWCCRLQTHPLRLHRQKSSWQRLMTSPACHHRCSIWPLRVSTVKSVCRRATCVVSLNCPRWVSFGVLSIAYHDIFVGKYKDSDGAQSMKYTKAA